MGADAPAPAAGAGGSGSTAPFRWLVLPGWACPAASFDALRDVLRARGSHAVLDVRDAWREPVLAAGLDDVLGGASYDGVVGHSLGGLLAIELALHRPGRVGCVVLLDPTGPREQGPPAVVRRVLRRAVPAVLRSARALGLLVLADRLVGRRWRALGVASTGLLRRPAAWARLWDELEAGWDRARRVDGDLAAGGLPQGADLLVPRPATTLGRRAQRRLAHRLAAATHHAVGAGHLVMCDRPDAVADVLVRAEARARGRRGGEHVPVGPGRGPCDEA